MTAPCGLEKEASNFADATHKLVEGIGPIYAWSARAVAFPKLCRVGLQFKRLPWQLWRIAVDVAARLTEQIFTARKFEIGNFPMNMNRVIVVGIAVTTLSFGAMADDDGDHRRSRQGSEYKHQYRDGNCKVERKREKDGKFEEKIDCKGGRYGSQARSEFKEEFQDGNCRVKRELQRDGDYKEERKCKAFRRSPASGPVYVESQSVYVYPLRWSLSPA